MKKRKVAFGLLLTLCIGAAALMGAGGSDPLVSLSYLQGKFSNELSAEMDDRLDAADQAVQEELQKQIQRWGETTSALQGQDYAAEPTEAMLKRGDRLTGATGLTVTPTGGTVYLECGEGAVVDVTTGSAVRSGTTLEVMHRYLVAEDTVAGFVAASPAVTLRYQGSCTLSLSQEQDYWATAHALQTLGLFRGSGTAIGEGFDLHQAPNRGQGLVMFIRLLGEENDALNCTCDHPFQDVPGWLDRYVAWAYAKGYTNGVNEERFGTDDPMDAAAYVEFLLRALGYSTAGVDDYRTSLERALNCGLLTNGEYQILLYEPFLRAHLVYVSYYALDMVSSQGISLAQDLMSRGVFTQEQWDLARTEIKISRSY